MQCLLFNELVNVRYREKKAREVPLFRTLQWACFVISMVYTYGESLIRLLGGFFANNFEKSAFIRIFIRYHGAACFYAYSLLFVTLVLSLKKGYYRYQMGQLTWTCVILLLIVLQIKQITNNIFMGLIWVLLPASMIICNDTMAYFCGYFFGKKFIKMPFLKLSPNKTWEGFIGGGICTLLFSFFWPLILIKFQWLICPINELSLWPDYLQCTPHEVFLPKEYIIPDLIAKFIGINSFQAIPVQFHAIFLALYASIVAPFGGFFASAIKRAYKLKDFQSYIPGHGGIMDRVDCQLLMALCTAVHINTFIRSVEVTVSSVLAQITRLHTAEQIEVYEVLGKMLN